MSTAQSRAISPRTDAATSDRDTAISMPDIDTAAALLHDLLGDVGAEFEPSIIRTAITKTNLYVELRSGAIFILLDYGHLSRYWIRIYVLNAAGLPSGVHTSCNGTPAGLKKLIISSVVEPLKVLREDIKRTNAVSLPNSASSLRKHPKQVPHVNHRQPYMTGRSVLYLTPPKSSRNF